MRAEGSGASTVGTGRRTDRVGVFVVAVLVVLALSGLAAGASAPPAGVWHATGNQFRGSFATRVAMVVMLRTSTALRWPGRGRMSGCSPRRDDRSSGQDPDLP